MRLGTSSSRRYSVSLSKSRFVANLLASQSFRKEVPVDMRIHSRRRRGVSLSGSFLWTSTLPSSRLEPIMGKI
eukprot:13185399-Heterocapsa_arctica.AAC.1